MKISLAAFTICAVCAHVVTAGEIKGTVSNATAKYATVVSNSNLMPVPGDKAQIYFILPGANVEISVASGHVYEITGSNIMIQIDKATGTVAKNQLVRITSTDPKKTSDAGAPASSGGARSASAHTPPNQTSTPSPSATKTAQPSTPIQKVPADRQANVSGGAVTGSGPADLVNPAQRLVGTWQGPQHRTQFFADGTYVTDPHLVPNPPRFKWRVAGDELVKYSPQTGITIFKITSRTDRELVVRDEKGETYHIMRIPNAQPAQGKAVATSTPAAHPAKQIIGNSKAEVDTLLAGWQSHKSDFSTGNQLAYDYQKDVNLTVWFKNGKASGVVVTDRPGVAGAAAISDVRYKELVALIGGGEPNPNDILRIPAEIHSFSVGEVK
jgi:hypothetical protein